MNDLGGSSARGQTLTLIGRRERLWRILRRAGRVVSALAVVAFIGLLASPSITGWMLDREKARLRAEGVPTTLAEVVPRLPPGKPNAADVYQEAFRLLDLTKAEEDEFLGMKSAPGDPQWRERAQPILVRNRAFLEHIEQASTIPDCAFPVDRGGFPEDVTYPHYSSLRHAVRLLEIRAAILASDGHGDQALSSSGMMLRIAGHLDNEPDLISQLVKWLAQGRAVLTAEQVMSTSDVSPSACRVLRSAVASTDLRTSLVRALKGECAVTTDPGFRRIYERHLSTHSWARSVLLSAADLDTITYIRAMEEQTGAVWLRWPASWSRAQRAEADAESRAMRRYGLGTVMLLPVVARAIESCSRTQARLDSLNIALALKQYKAQRGEYPDSLATLRSAGFDIRRDPFTGKEFVYRREGAGFLVYSLGPDMDDDNGRDFLKDKVRSEKPTERGKELWDTDVPFRCTR